MSQRTTCKEPTQYLYDNNTWLYKFMYAFFYVFVQNNNYAYDLKPTKKVNILPITLYTYDTFSVLNTDYDYFCGDMNKLALQNGYFSVSAASSSVFWKHTATEFETGFDYFGARYYASDLSVWNSVDPMSDMYPSTSPFMYVRGNPVMLVDPNGMFDDGFKTDANGNLTWVDKTGGDDYDIVYSNNDDGTVNMDESKALCVEKGVIQNSTHSNNTTSNKQYSIYEFDSHDDGKRFFEFMSQNTDVEWSHTKFTKGNKELSVITTTHEADFEAGASDLLFTSPSYDEYTFVGHDHNHRDGYWYPSGSDQEILYGGVRFYKGDIRFTHKLELCVPNSFKTRIYDLENNSYFKYNSKFYYNPRDLPVIEIKAEKKP